MSLKSKLGHVVSCLLLVMSSNAANAATVYASTWYMSDGTTGDVYYIDASDEEYQSGLYFDLVGNSAVDPQDFHGPRIYTEIVADDPWDIVISADPLGEPLITSPTTITRRILDMSGPYGQMMSNTPPSTANCGLNTCEFGYSIRSPSGSLFTAVQYDETFTLVSEVPVPAAVWLFGSGFLALIGVSRRKKTT